MAQQAVEQGRVISCELITQQLWRSQYLKAALRASLGMDPTTKGPIREEELEYLYEAYIEKSATEPIWRTWSGMLIGWLQKTLPS